MTTAELRKATSLGQVTAEELFPKLSIELLKLANNGDQLAASLTNTNSAINRFKNNVWLANATFNQSGFDKTVRDLFNTMSDAIQKAEPVWIMLGKASEYLGLALEAPIELFGELGEKLGFVTDKGFKFNTELKLITAAVIAAFRPLRKLFAVFFLYPLAISAVTDTLDNGFDSWNDFFTKMAIWAATAASLYSSIKGIGKVFGKTKVPTMGKASAAGSMMGAFAKGALRVTIIGIAASVLMSIAGAMLQKDSVRNYEIQTGKGALTVGQVLDALSNGEKLGNLTERYNLNPDVLRTVIDNFSQQALSQSTNKSFGVLNDKNIDDWLKSQQKPYQMINDKNIDALLKSQQKPYQMITDKNIDAWLKSQQKPYQMINDKNIDALLKSQQKPYQMITDKNIDAWLKSQQKPYQMITDKNIDAWLKSQQKPYQMITDKNIDAWLKSQQKPYQMITDKNIDAYLKSQTGTTQSPITNKNMYGDINITIDGGDIPSIEPEVLRVVNDMFNTTSGNDPITER